MASGPIDDDFNDGGKRVTDEEGTVDQKIKNRIIETRKRVTQREDEIFVGAQLDEDTNRPWEQLVQIWSVNVKQYLRSIEPLLRSDDIPNARYYYHDLPIVDKMVPPPDGETEIVPPGKNENPYVKPIRWRQFYGDDGKSSNVTKNHSEFDNRFTPPDPKPLKLHGLKSIIESDAVQHKWTVVMNPKQIEPHQIVAEIDYVSPLRKQWLENAVRHADEFLQQAGVGLDIGWQSTDESDENPF